MSTPFPDLHTGQLDAALLKAYFTDLEQDTVRVLSVQTKGPLGHFGQSSEQSLPALCEALLQHQVTAAQVRYEYAQALWCDTLLYRGETLQLTRVRIPV